VVRPDDEPDHRDANTGSRDEVITKNRFAGEGRNDFADHAHGWKNHDVYGRMRVEPEKVLEQNRSPPYAGLKKPK